MSEHERKQLVGLPDASEVEEGDVFLKRDAASGTDQKATAKLVADKFFQIGSVTTATGEQAISEALDQRGPVFDSVEDMQAAAELTVGVKVRTLGRYAPGDGGGADYGVVPASTATSFGFLFEELTASGLEAKLLSGGIMEDKTVLIPTDYATLQEAIDDLSGIIVKQGVTITLNIESGHNPSSGILVENGDYSHFVVTSTDAEVLIAPGFGQSNPFIRGDNASMPVLGCLVDGDAGELGHGYQVLNNSRGYVREDCGVKNAWQDGLSVKYGSTCYAENTVFTGNAVNAGTSSGIHVLAAICHADGADVSGSGYYGAQASAAGQLSIVGGTANNTGRYGFRARDGGVINANGATANDNAVYGFYAFNQGQVFCRFATALRNGTSNCVASRASAMCGADGEFDDATGTNIQILNGSSGDFDNASIDGAGIDGVLVSASVCSLFAASTSNNTGRGVRAEGAAIVRARAIKADNNGTLGISAEGGATVEATGVSTSIKGNDIGAQALGGTIDVSEADCQSNTSRGVYALRGGKVSAYNTLCQKIPDTDTGGSNADITCLDGGMVSANGASGGVNKTVNTLDGNGIIFR